MKQVPRAIAIGYVTDVLCTKLFLLVLAVVLLDPGSSSEAPIQHIDIRLLEWFALCWGLFFTGLGGFVATRLAPRLGLLVASGVGWLSLLTSWADGFTASNVDPLLYFVGISLTLPVALLGSVLARTVR